MERHFGGSARNPATLEAPLPTTTGEKQKGVCPVGYADALVFTIRFETCTLLCRIQRY
jgi:hypothetical protein